MKITLVDRESGETKHSEEIQNVPSIKRMHRLTHVASYFVGIHLEMGRLLYCERNPH